MTESLSTTGASVKTMESPKSPKGSNLDDALAKTREFLLSVQQISRDTEELDKVACTESRAHREVKALLKKLEGEHAQIQKAHHEEREDHGKTKLYADERKKLLCRKEEELKVAKDDLQTVRLENEALRVEMEAKRQAFVVNLNMAGRHAELRAKHDEVMEENNNLRQRLADLRHKIEQGATDAGELENLRAQVESERMKKDVGKKRALVALERSLANTAQGLLAACTRAWSDAIRAEKQAQKKKDEAMAKGMRAIAGSSSALMQECFKMWDKIKDETLKRSLQDTSLGVEAEQRAEQDRARDKVIRQLEKQFGASSQRLVRRCFDVFKDQKKNRLAKERAKNSAARCIANSDKGLLDLCISSWGTTVKELRRNRANKDKSMAKAMQMISAHDTVLKGTIVNMWQRDVRTELEQKRLKTEGSTKAMRMISNSTQAIIASVCQGWIMMHQKEKVKANKMKMIERNLVSSAEGLQAIAHREWAKYARECAMRNKAKEQSMNISLRKINGSNMALLDKVFAMWHKERERAKKDRLIERGRNSQVEIEKSKAEIAQILQRSQAEMDAQRRRSEEQQAAFEKQLREEKEIGDAKICELTRLVEEKDSSLSTAFKELHDSRGKAACIGDELAKVGMFLQRTPRRAARPTSGSMNGRARPQTPTSPDGALPRINAGATTPRPLSGTGRTKAGGLPGTRLAWQGAAI